MINLEWAKSLFTRFSKPKFGQCIIHKTNRFYKIITDSKTKAGFLLGGDPVFLVEVDNVKELENSIFESLLSSKSGVPVPSQEGYKIGEKDLCKKLGETSFTALYKGSNALSVSFENNELKLIPLKYYNPLKASQGLVDVTEDAQLIVDPFNNKEQVTSLVIQLLEKDYRLS
jgi:hypothetical protein